MSEKVEAANDDRGDLDSYGFPLVVHNGGLPFWGPVDRNRVNPGACVVNLGTLSYGGIDKVIAGYAKFKDEGGLLNVVLGRLRIHTYPDFCGGAMLVSPNVFTMHDWRLKSSDRWGGFCQLPFSQANPPWHNYNAELPINPTRSSAFGVKAYNLNKILSKDVVDEKEAERWMIRQLASNLVGAISSPARRHLVCSDWYSAGLGSDRLGVHDIVDILKCGSMRGVTPISVHARETQDKAGVRISSPGEAETIGGLSEIPYEAKVVSTEGINYQSQRKTRSYSIHMEYLNRLPLESRPDRLYGQDYPHYEHIEKFASIPNLGYVVPSTPWKNY
jgi:hypothetical protein